MVLSTWEVERAQRAARADEDGPSVSSQCRLQSLSVSLRKFLLEPSKVNINNCEGECKFPLTGSNNNHAILLNSHIQSGEPINRSLCCVPVEFDDLSVIELESESTKISFKTNVVATKCECRWRPPFALWNALMHAYIATYEKQPHTSAFIFACKYTKL